MSTKFKNGDVVRCINKDGTGGYRFGSLYRVKDTYYYHGHERIHTENDSNGSTTNGWGVKNFEPATEKGWLADACDKAAARASEMPDWMTRKAPTSTPTILGTQVGGSHYTDCTIQPIEYIWANKLGFSEGNVVKYITRWKSKGGIKDLEKAKHHIALLIEHELAVQASAG